MEFTTVFDLTLKSVRAEAMPHLIGSIVLIIGGLTGVIFNKWAIKKLQIRVARSIFGIMILLGLWWCIGHIGVINYAILNKAKNAQVVEGIVHVSHMQPYHGHTSGDKITVNGEPFEVDFFYAGPGYKDTIARGGALREGTYARIHHCDGVIVKVEVKKSRV
jgi:hypothetical protein